MVHFSFIRVQMTAIDVNTIICMNAFPAAFTNNLNILSIRMCVDSFFFFQIVGFLIQILLRNVMCNDSLCTVISMSNALIWIEYTIFNVTFYANAVYDTWVRYKLNACPYMQYLKDRGRFVFVVVLANAILRTASTPMFCLKLLCNVHVRAIKWQWFYLLFPNWCDWSKTHSA